MAEVSEHKKKYLAYLKSAEWFDLKRHLIEKRGCKCEICGCEKGNMSELQVHHLTYVRLYSELPSDLIILCPPCHANEHGIWDKKQARWELVRKKPVKHKRKKKVDKGVVVKRANKSLERIERRHARGYYANEGVYLKAKAIVTKRLKAVERGAEVKLAPVVKPVKEAAPKQRKLISKTTGEVIYLPAKQTD